MTFAMSVARREAFLAEPRVGVLAVVDARSGSAPAMMPLWYLYQPGGRVLILTGRESVKARLILAAGRFGLCVHDDDTPPGGYVSVEGPVVGHQDPADPGLRSALARRYVADHLVGDYLGSTAGHLPGLVAFWMQPQNWRSADFSAHTFYRAHPELLRRDGSADQPGGSGGSDGPGAGGRSSVPEPSGNQSSSSNGSCTHT